MKKNKEPKNKPKPENRKPSDVEESGCGSWEWTQFIQSIELRGHIGLARAY